MIEEATPDTEIAIRLRDFDAMRERLLAAEARVEELEADAAVWEQHGLAETARERDVLRKRIEELESICEQYAPQHL